MTRLCIVCGAPFSAPPSSKKITCSKECSSIRKSQTHKGKSNRWASDKREHARKAAAFTGNLSRGTEAALKLPGGQRGPQNREAMIWHLRDPDGHPVVVVNLTDWARRHAQDYFGMEPTDHNAWVIASGIWDVAHATIRDIRAYTGLTQAAFSTRYCIPRRTLENWESGIRSCPDYVRLLLAQAAGMYRRPER